VSEIKDGCTQFTEISILYTSDSLSASQINYLNRITYRTSEKNIPLIVELDLFFDCAEIEEDLALVNNEGIWGTYELSREGVDQLLTELDILIIQKSYGEGISR